MEIGSKVKELRVQHGLTQEELASRCELSKGSISMIENDLTSPSVSTIEVILEVFGMCISEFFSLLENNEEERVVYKEEDYYIQEEDGYEISYLITDAQSKEIEALRIVLEPGAESMEIQPNEGDLFGYVLEGKIELYLNDKCYKLKSGESFYYSKPMAIQTIKNGCEKNQAKFVWISTPPLF